jgi:phosphopantothenoylcysteine decarboxylase/phosphopantothenate--cysteine ligase
VADWRIANASEQKLKKNPDGTAPDLKFEQNPTSSPPWRRANLAGHPYCVGFAAESENLVKFGADKREKKGIPLLVGNIGHHTFGQDDNTIILFDENGHTILPRADKLTLARQLISRSRNGSPSIPFC